LRVELGPVVPALLWGIRCEMAAARAGIEGLTARFCPIARSTDVIVWFVEVQDLSRLPGI
jgi:hypothetical protein